MPTITDSRYEAYALINGTQYPIILITGSSPGFYVFTDEVLAIGDLISFNSGSMPICFGPDTFIDVQGGAARVSELQIGEFVKTPSGLERIKFIGRSTRFIPDLRVAGGMPVLISSNAFGELGPSRDLVCSPSHAIYFQGLLIEAQALLNGDSISQLEELDSFKFTYYSLELENHSLVWANGMLAETYFANVRGKCFSRESWDNYADYVALYGDGEPMKELELPRIPFARQLPAEIRQLAGVPDPAEAEAALYALS